MSLALVLAGWGNRAHQKKVMAEGSLFVYALEGLVSERSAYFLSAGNPDGTVTQFPEQAQDMSGTVCSVQYEEVTATGAMNLESAFLGVPCQGHLAF